MKYRKKPVVIEAMRFAVEDVAEDGTPLWAPPNDEIAYAIQEWQMQYSDSHHRIGFQPSTMTLLIPTLEGVMRAEAGDWVIKGVKDEFYPCKPDIFEATYERVE